MELDELRDKWVEARPYYEAFAGSVCGALQRETKQRGIRCEVTYRCKDIASFLKKVIRKVEYTNPWEQIRDKAGVRVIVPYQSSLRDLEALVREQFEIEGYENKAEQIGYDRLGYLGIHFEVSIRGASPFAGMICEIQLHTSAQHLWSAMSHQLAYKASQTIPQVVQRSIYRLVALMEIFDKEVTADRDEILRLPGHEEYAMLDQLERNFYPLVARDYDKALSLHIISELKELYAPGELQTFDVLIGSFVQHNRRKLGSIYERYAADDRIVLLFQPESLLIFERAVHDPFVLVNKWEQFFPVDLLQQMTTVWGIPI